MYIYEWDTKTGGIILTFKTSLDDKKYVAKELRPVWASELKLIGFDKFFSFDENVEEPICWAIHNSYFYHGEQIAVLEKTQYGQQLNPKFLVPPQKLEPIDVVGMLNNKQNQTVIDALVSDTKKRIKELFEKYQHTSDIYLMV